LGDNATEVSDITASFGLELMDWVLLRQIVIMNKVAFILQGWRELLEIEARLNSTQRQEYFSCGGELGELPAADFGTGASCQRKFSRQMERGLWSAEFSEVLSSRHFGHLGFSGWLPCPMRPKFSWKLTS
jgi:hypothetical protein